MDRSRHTVTKKLSDEKTHGAINTKFFKRLDHIKDQLYEVDLAKAEIEHRESIILGFFILQFAKVRTLEFYYNFSERFCDVNKLEDLEMDTDFCIWLCLKRNCTIAFEKNLNLKGN